MFPIVDCHLFATHWFCLNPLKYLAYRGLPFQNIESFGAWSPRMSKFSESRVIVGGESTY